MSSTESLHCTALEKTYSQGDLNVEVLKGINLSVTGAERLAIVGASGSGKSTLLHILGGLDVPSSGTVTIAGVPLAGLSEVEKGDLRNEKLGFVYQFHHLLPEFTALENVALPLLIRGSGSTEATQTAAEFLESVGLGNRKDHKPSEMSGGERQRAAIARAMVTRPQCILADEPTGNLDEQTAAQVFEVMLELNSKFGTSLVMATHNMGLINSFDRVQRLHDGVLENYQA